MISALKAIVLAIISTIKYIIKNVSKKVVIIFCVGLSFVLIGILSWNIIFSKYYIFHQSEKLFLETVKDYYEYHPVYLPKNNQVKTMKLEQLYKEDRIEELKVPKKDKLCSTDSWVKVYNDNGNYKYYTYLKCGRYQSRIDHVGPTITLNGDSTIYVDLNHKYNELGVKEVKDNKDGKIDISKVVIDNSKVNTKKLGKYQVTYTVRDSLNNETKEIRTVVVTRNLTTIANDNTDDTGYFKGNVSNNYVLFSGILYRMINVNSDGTVKLISNDAITNLRTDYINYENSNVDEYLTNVFLPTIYDPSYLVEYKTCIGNIESIDNVQNNCSNSINRKVAILDINEYLKTFDNNKSFISNNFIYALSGKITDDTTNTIVASDRGNNKLESFSNDNLIAIRPVITLKANLLIASGDGTSSKPYKLNDYSYGKQQTPINKRIVGEYVNYSGSVFRIIGIDDNNNVRLIANDGMSKKVANISGKQYLRFSFKENKKYKFNPQEEGNVAYILNNNYIDYINDSHIIKTDYEIPLNVSGVNYSKYKTTKVSTKIFLAKTYDLFSSQQIVSEDYLYLYADESNSDDKAFYMFSQEDYILEDQQTRYREYGLKIVITVKGSLVIKSGNGTVNKPYYIG